MALADLQTAINNLDARIKDVTANPKPNYSIDGVSYNFGDYLNTLITSRAALREAIQTESGQYEIETRGIT